MIDRWTSFTPGKGCVQVGTPNRSSASWVLLLWFLMMPSLQEGSSCIPDVLVLCCHPSLFNVIGSNSEKYALYSKVTVHFLCSPVSVTSSREPASVKGSQPTWLNIAQIKLTLYFLCAQYCLSHIAKIFSSNGFCLTMKTTPMILCFCFRCSVESVLASEILKHDFMEPNDYLRKDL